MNASLKPFHLALVSGLVPILAVHLAWALNVVSGDAPACIPYWDGCVSVSRAARSGPGLHLFRALVLPTTVVMAATWLLAARWLRHYSDPSERVRRAVAVLGVTGAAFLVLYATWLGTEGPWYGWLRRYGVIFFFSLTALAQLVLADRLWRHRQKFHEPGQGGALRAFVAFTFGEWALGVGSAFKRLFIEDPALLDRVENAVEWNFALFQCLAFVALAYLFRASLFSLRTSVREP